MNTHNDDYTFLLSTALILMFHVVVSYITISVYGLSFITVFAAPAAFLFYCALFQPVIVIALIALIALYHIAPNS